MHVPLIEGIHQIIDDQEEGVDFFFQKKFFVLKLLET